MSTFTITLVLLAWLQASLSQGFEEAVPLTIVDPTPSICGVNEEFSDCGNLCEDSCNNRCEPPVLQYFSQLNSATNPACQPGCYCKPGYIRNLNNNCVTNTPNVCGSVYNRCGVISPYAVYQKCVAGVPLACFERNIAIRPAGYNGRCVCQTGYSMNLNKKCVLTGSWACRSQQTQLSSILFMQTTWDC